MTRTARMPARPRTLLGRCVKAAAAAGAIAALLTSGAALTLAEPPATAAATVTYGGFEMGVQSNTGSLVELGDAGSSNTGQAVMAGTSPDVAALPAGGFEEAFQSAAGDLWTIGLGPGSSDRDWNLGMMRGTSPSIAALPAGGFEVAFQANTGVLWTVGFGPGGSDPNWNLGMMRGTSPSITTLSGGGFEVAFQANTGALWTVGFGPGGSDPNWGLGMMQGTSPSIAALSRGGFEVAFQANTGILWTVGLGPGSGDPNWGLGMMRGTSPSIAALSFGGFEAAFQANTGILWEVGSVGSRDTGQAMMAGTNPAIATAPDGYEVALQSNTGALVEYGIVVDVATGQEMTAGTSPTIAGLANTKSTSSGAASPYKFGATGYDISWPHCGGAYPPQSPVAVVGVNGGSAFTANPCFGSEALWGGPGLTVYLNLNSPQGSDSSQWAQGPAGTCAIGALDCESYNYGYNTADQSIQTAMTSGYSTYSWWLDVETGNYWTSDTTANAQVIAGAVAAIHAAGYRAAIYSTNFQWGQIAGSYVPSTPAWYPTGTSTSTPYNWCSSSSFAGGPVDLVQTSAGSFDGDYSC
jgi:hypothetical protein